MFPFNGQGVFFDRPVNKLCPSLLPTYECTQRIHKEVETAQSTRDIFLIALLVMWI
jgi:hypothetical protein